MNKCLSLLFIFSLLMLKTSAQLEKVFVETYYVSDSYDATDSTGGGLDVGSKTYRIYIDLVPGSKLHSIYGDVNHALKFSSTSNFFNNKADGQTFGKDFPKNRLQENTVALDTWLALGQTTKLSTTKTYFGVPKPYDDDGSFIGGANNDGGSGAISTGLLINNDPLAGIPLTVADGMDTMTILPVNWVDDGIVNSGIDSTIFGSVIPGNLFNSYSAYIKTSGVMGVIPDSNQVLVAQLTTSGEISFELNIKVLTSTGDTITYVANDSINLLSDEILSSYLKYPFVQVCGCPDPDYLEYKKFRDCDNASACQHLIVFGCTDPNACNYDENANFNLPQLCCYPGYCNDRDISVVCPSIEEVQKTFDIYPNPAQQRLTVNVTNRNDEIIHYVIYNSFGKTMIENYASLSDKFSLKEVDVSGLETGLYMFRLFTNGSAESKIFMKN